MQVHLPRVQSTETSKHAISLENFNCIYTRYIIIRNEYRYLRNLLSFYLPSDLYPPKSKKKKIRRLEESEEKTRFPDKIIARFLHRVVRKREKALLVENATAVSSIRIPTTTGGHLSRERDDEKLVHAN